MLKLLPRDACNLTLQGPIMDRAKYSLYHVTRAATSWISSQVVLSFKLSQFDGNFLMDTTKFQSIAGELSNGYTYVID